MSDGLTIRVDGIELWGHCGVTPAEREVGQLLRVDVRVVPAQANGVVTDNLDDTVNYVDVVRSIKACVESTSFALIERLAGEILERLWTAHELRELAVTVTKPAPPVGFAVCGASVELVRRS